MVKQSGAGLMAELQHQIESILLAVIRVWHLAQRLIRGKIQVKPQLILQCRRAKPLHGVQMAPVHCQQQVKALEIGGNKLAGAQVADLDAAGPGGADAARIGRVANMVVMRAGGIDLHAGVQSLLVQMMPQHRFGGG